MKCTKGGVVSPDQKNIIAYLESVGYQVIVGKGFLHAKEQIEQFIVKN